MYSGRLREDLAQGQAFHHFLQAQPALLAAWRGVLWTVFSSEQTEILLLPMPVSSTERQGVVSCGLEMRSQNDDGAWALPRYEENGCESRTFLLEMCFLRTVEYDPSTTKQWALRGKGPSLRTLQTCVPRQMHICMVAHTLTHPHGHLHMGKLELRSPWLFSTHVAK